MTMQQVVQAGIDVFTKEVEKLGSGVYVLTPYTQDFKFFAYIGFGNENFFVYEKALKNGDAMKFETRVDIKAIEDLNFKSLGELEGTLSEDGVSVAWYEQGIYATKSEITADSATTAVVVADISRFAVGQLVSTQPVAGSAGTEVTATVTAVTVGTSTVTLSSAVNTKNGDMLVILQQLQEVGQKVTGSYAGPKSDKLFSVYGKFGSEINFTLAEINTTRFFSSPETYIDNKIKLNTIKIYNEMANIFFKGTNTTGTKPIAEGLEHVISERDTAGLLSKFTLAGADDEAKLNDLVDYFDLASQSPIYMNEQPVLICNKAFAGRFAGALRTQDRQVVDNGYVDALKYGLESITTPYLSGKGVVVCPHMNNLYGNKAVGFIIPKHLITFKQPLFQLIKGADGQITAVKNAPGKILIIPQAQVTGDEISTAMEYYQANMFAGQTYENSYMKILWN